MVFDGHLPGCRACNIADAGSILKKIARSCMRTSNSGHLIRTGYLASEIGDEIITSDGLSPFPGGRAYTGKRPVAAIARSITLFISSGRGGFEQATEPKAGVL
jgi:hypothetical protein